MVHFVYKDFTIYLSISRFCDVIVAEKRRKITVGKIVDYQTTFDYFQTILASYIQAVLWPSLNKRQKIGENLELWFITLNIDFHVSNDEIISIVM